MKQSLLTLSIISIMFFSSCNQDEVQPVEDDVILLSDRNELTKALIIPGKKIIKGSLPATAGNFIYTYNLTTNQNTANGATTALNFPVDQNVSRLYLQVQGADSYIEVPIKPRADGMVLVPITIPSNTKIDTKTFTINYKVFNDNGTVSNELKMDYNVTQKPVGEVVVSLTWNSASDLSMTIEKPIGVAIVGRGVNPGIYGGDYIYEKVNGYISDSNKRYAPQFIYWKDIKFDGAYYINVQQGYGLQSDSDYFITISANNSTKVFEGFIKIAGTENYVTSFTVDGENVQF